MADFQAQLALGISGRAAGATTLGNLSVLTCYGISFCFDTSLLVAQKRRGKASAGITKKAWNTSF